MIDWNLVLTMVVAFFAIILLPKLIAILMFILSRCLYWVSEHVGTEDERSRMRLRNSLARYRDSGRLTRR